MKYPLVKIEDTYTVTIRTVDQRESAMKSIDSFYRFMAFLLTN